MNSIAYIETIAFAAIIFLAIILSLAIPPKHTKRVLGWIAVFTVTAALGLYGFGYGYKYLNMTDNTDIYTKILHTVTSILRTVFDSCRIFVGSNNWSEVKEAYSEKYGWEFIFWLVHLLAMTTSASAVIVSLGSGLLKIIRLRVLRMRNITLIFGLNENTLDFGRELAREEKNSILYVDNRSETRLHSSVDQIGALLRIDTDALNGNEHFLKKIGLKPGKRKLKVFALDHSVLCNQQYAKQLLDSLEKLGILPEQTSLTILSVGDETDNPLQAAPGRYGYGNLISINEPDMVARLLIRTYPPYKSVLFDETGKALTDFHAVVIGFGRVGQAVLRRLIMNSQFQGSNCRIAVFAPDYENQMGWISHECQEMLNHYNIAMFPYDGRSRQFYDYMAENLDSINYIAICAGREAVSLEIGELLQSYLLRRGSSAPIFVCSRNGVHCQSAEDHIISHQIYTPEILCSEQLDRMAMILNQSHAESGEMLENWRNCSYFDRMSSRAAADYYDTLLHCAGVTPEMAIKNWDPQGMLMENLAASEHLRWNAFLYCMGFRPMTEQEFQERAAVYLAEKAKDPDTKYRITKDMDKRIHACLIPWEALGAYSKKENAVTGGNVDYAEYDRKNVRDLAKVLQTAMQES